MAPTFQWLTLAVYKHFLAGSLLVMAKLVFVASVLFAVCYGERMVGAPRELSVDDKGLQEALRFAMYEYNKASNDMYQSRLGKVHNATMQVSDITVLYPYPKPSHSGKQLINIDMSDSYRSLFLYLC